MLIKYNIFNNADTACHILVIMFFITIDYVYK